MDADLDKMDERERRAREVLAQFAASPPMKITDFLRQVDVSPSTWAEWKRQPWFREEWKEIVQQRIEIAITPIYVHLDGMSAALAKKALAGDVAAIRLAWESIGLVKSGTSVNVRATANAGATADASAEPGSTDLDALLVRHRQLRDAISRRAARARATATGSGDTGPEADGGEPEAGPGEPGPDTARGDALDQDHQPPEP